MTMRKGDIVNGYEILEDFKVIGGMSKISFAKKGGHEFFIKEFLSPKYPQDDSPGSAKNKNQKRRACEMFEQHHKELNNKIREKVKKGGNLVFAVDFFRYKTCYYKVTEKIDKENLTCKEISELPFDSILLIAKCVCHSIRILHELNIVHGDLKPENILIKKTNSDMFSGKLIDFDDSFFNKKPPRDRDMIVGTPEYYSPEQADYIMDEDKKISGETLTLKSDVFTLGIILCEYFTGSKPLFEDGKGNTWSYIKNKKKYRFVRSINEGIEDLIKRMLSLDPKDRPSIKDVFEKLRNPKVKKDEVNIEKGTLQGTGIRIAKNGSSKTKLQSKTW